ncbi:MULTISPECIES: 3-deoxy-manno-octulosonate cytidylyltransferase [Psychrilyobacter]|uniref:3-deoxy-manno-octulosonate cytidylyltransferase n=1 Tax=Psychrilyobacter piezotolerans TaxID=2293438 RepID=A0ABX9KF46_9FUSO|nr:MULTISPECIES: 3-deoxy-manno-octulosonate cytidylyltransferase [Psychrilyobacter]MCS5421563.1 3-deoxy-manno-octulosonate cytidylyltransferase [Psychrilyobacter sp. S5]NDI78593.1 3-deoxy-manno-octulosonate cytidylyltransferase [Psychrilyobacter piezotolerans]RDE60296.1 3-deoxy-manno-octulosonate cytidylyltransferase [Psychrilyobacter sp. S5]REI40404.1 3-deoxy-manno-octulosonate cytidylyltransferase [Psychrilyobacter piezotolerans]
MKFLGVIPARYASTRLEGKPLADIGGHSMIEWVYKRTLLSDLDMVVVATDDQLVYDKVKSFGGEVVMTSEDHPNGTSRIAEVAGVYSDFDVIINVQGDEPLIEKEMINALITPFLEEPDLSMATLKHRIDRIEEVENPNNVKVVTTKDDYAIYFSRSPIPYPRELDMKNYFKHVGIYGYRRDFVIKYSQMAPTPLEVSESLEQLRVLENGYRIKVLETPYKIVGVDTKEDLERVRKIVKENKITI